MKKGIDISSYQGNVIWESVRSQVDFVIIKATQGVGETDPNLTENANGASKVNIPLTFYHFATLNKVDVVSDATAEANYFLSKIKTLPKPSLPLALDIETNTSSIKPNDVVTYINTFIGVLKSAGYDDVAIYSSPSFLNSNLPKGHGLGKYKLWIAEYTNAPKPIIPDGWADYWCWQHSETGKIDGIVGNVDLNTMNETAVVADPAATHDEPAPPQQPTEPENPFIEKF